MAKKDETKDAPETTEAVATEEVAQDSQENGDTGAAETAAGAEGASGPSSDDGSDTGGRNSRKVRIGVVTSDKQDKTVTVQVERIMAHPLYGKRMARTKKYHAHDENNEFQVGDKVRIGETRPLSKTKRWRVIELLERPE